MSVRNAIKRLVRGLALVAVTPALISYFVRSAVIGRDRALEGSTQMLSQIPGLPGQYLRAAFLSRTLERCDVTASIGFGTIFSQTGARIDEHVYVGPGCYLGLVHLQRGVLIGSGVHITSGRHTHGTSDMDLPIREQPIVRTCVTIGAGAWIGSAAVVMADVGEHTVVGAGAVVTRPLPASVMAAGVPARVIKGRDALAHDEVPMPVRS
jgi:virginiamycin A acetyltransferase